MRNMRSAALAVLLALAPMAAHAGPETLDQLEPDGGEWELEWLGDFGGAGEQGFEALYGVSERLAIGAEIEFEGPRDGLVFEGAAAVALYRLTDPDADGLGLGVMGEVEMARGGSFAGVEARAIAEWQSEKWWLQANLILRHAREDGAGGTGLAYATSVQGMAGGLWLGVEASGQAARFSGSPALTPKGQHYAGPSITLERDIGEDAEIEVGFAWLARLRGDGPRSHPRVLVQFIF